MTLPDIPTGHPAADLPYLLVKALREEASKRNALLAMFHVGVCNWCLEARGSTHSDCAPECPLHSDTFDTDTAQEVLQWVASTLSPDEEGP